MKVHRIASKDQWQAVEKAAQDDGHYPWFATHFFTKGDEIVGAFNVGPMICWWLRTDQKISDTIRAGKLAQELIKEVGLSRVLMFVAENSPYMGHMERLGFMPDAGNFRCFVQTEDFNNVWAKSA